MYIYLYIIYIYIYKYINIYISIDKYIRKIQSVYRKNFANKLKKTMTIKIITHFLKKNVIKKVYYKLQMLL